MLYLTVTERVKSMLDTIFTLLHAQLIYYLFK